MNQREHQQLRGSPAVRQRTTDTPLAAPSTGSVFLALSGLMRLRCPNCRRGQVLRGWYQTRERCSICNFRYERSDDNYFQGAMFVSFMIGGFTFLGSLLAVSSGRAASRADPGLPPRPRHMLKASSLPPQPRGVRDRKRCTRAIYFHGAASTRSLKRSIV